MKNIKLQQLIITALIIMAISFLSGCGGDTGPQGVSLTGASIKVNVTLPDGNPAKNFTASIYRVNSSSDALQSSDQSGDGYYIFENVGQGTYKLIVKMAGYMPQETTVEVNEITEKNVTISLKKALYGISTLIGWKKSDISSSSTGMSDSFYFISSDTGETAFIGNTGFYHTTGMDINPADGILYALGTDTIKSKGASVESSSTGYSCYIYNRPSHRTWNKKKFHNFDR